MDSSVLLGAARNSDQVVGSMRDRRYATMYESRELSRAAFLQAWTRSNRNISRHVASNVLESPCSSIAINEISSRAGIGLRTTLGIRSCFRYRRSRSVVASRSAIASGRKPCRRHLSTTDFGPSKIRSISDRSRPHILIVFSRAVIRSPRFPIAARFLSRSRNCNSLIPRGRQIIKSRSISLPASRSAFRAREISSDSLNFRIPTLRSSMLCTYFSYLFRSVSVMRDLPFSLMERIANCGITTVRGTG